MAKIIKVNHAFVIDGAKSFEGQGTKQYAYKIAVYLADFLSAAISAAERKSSNIIVVVVIVIVVIIWCWLQAFISTTTNLTTYSGIAIQYSYNASQRNQNKSEALIVLLVSRSIKID